MNGFVETSSQSFFSDGCAWTTDVPDEIFGPSAFGADDGVVEDDFGLLAAAAAPKGEDFDTLESKYDNLNQTYESIVDQLKETQEKLDGVRNLYIDLEVKNKRLRTERNSYGQRFTALYQQCQNSHQPEILELTATLKEVEAERDVLRAKLAAEQESTMENFSVEKLKYSQELSTSRAELEISSARLQACEQDLEASKRELTQTTEALTKNSEVFRDAQDELAELNLLVANSNQKLEASNAELAALKQDLSEKDAELEAVSKKFEHRLEQKRYVTREALERLVDSKKECEILKQQFHEVAEEKLEPARNESANILRENDENGQELPQVKEELLRASQELKSLQICCDKSHEDYAALDTKHAELVNLNQDLANQLEIASAEIDKLDKMCGNLRCAVRDVHLEMQELEKNHETVYVEQEAEIRRLENEIQIHLIDLKEQKIEIYGLEEIIESSFERTERHFANFKFMQKFARANRKECDELKEELNELQQKFQQVVLEKKAAEADCAAAAKSSKEFQVAPALKDEFQNFVNSMKTNAKELWKTPEEFAKACKDYPTFMYILMLKGGTA